MMTDDQILEVVAAHKEGKNIESQQDYDVWRECIHPSWDFYRVKYRVAPEPRKPREWWAEVPRDGMVGQLFTDGRQVTVGGELIRVREILE